jgi:FHS family L-fucose permease-like MFS transporter
MNTPTVPPPNIINTSPKKGIFTGPDGKSLFFTFALVSSLFFLWAFCNGMIDVMDKHFQNELHLSLAQSAWVQFAHYLGYFLMAMPAGWLAKKLGYKGGIIGGLLMVAIGGFWFIPATKIATFPAFLLGVCVIASGLTFLETVANPYTTVLGPKQFAATRINLAQSCNGMGWIVGPLVGAKFFYSVNAAGQSTGSQTLWIPYATVAAIALALVVVFVFSRLPDLASNDEFHIDDNNKDVAYAPVAHKGVSFSLLWVNIAVLSVAVGMIFSAVAAIPAVGAKLGISDNQALMYTSGILLVIGTVVFLAKSNKVTNHSIWSHPHFSGATLAQFFYVAAQSGIFAFFTNYMTKLRGLSDASATQLASVAFACFLAGRVIGAALLKKFPAHKVLAAFAVASGVCSLIVMLQLGAVSAVALFLTYFFMSIMFPTIFALGIHGLGARAKSASSFIVMAIMGGAIVPKFMGHIGDTHGISAAFIVPLVCFVLIALYSFSWRGLCRAEADVTVDAARGH